MPKHSHSSCHRFTRRGAIWPVLWSAMALSGLAATDAQAVMRVGVQVEGTGLGSSNFNDRRNVIASYNYDREYAVPGALPPLWSSVRGFGESNGAAGTLKARATIVNAGPGLPTAELTMHAYMEENIRLYSTSGSGSRNVGVAGLGDPNDDFITVRARGTLLGSGVVGRATGLPPGLSTFAGGSTRANFSLSLGLDGTPMTNLSITEATNIEGTTVTRTNNPFSANLGNASIQGDAIIFNISKTFLTNHFNTTVYFGASLRAFARVGSFPGAEASANYHNSAYLDFDVEEGAFWLPDGTSATRKFLTAQVFPPAPVPEPGTYALMLAGLGVLGQIARRRRHARRA